ncbi:hypothetical protein GUJ93_ZPchr0007g3742 [Zizania palustris]|uniref:Uncharacterized protein n=1 Tax=Zizania palustris TaxID=103762 RepID=A0A8J5SV49_ZIZPA|nr:hypothetical protein GUJ93_ZPchr0007g3742 [Zizania palustris]
MSTPNSSNLQTVADMEGDAASAETPTSGAGEFSCHGAAEENTWNPWLNLNSTHQFLYYLPHGQFFSLHSALPCFSYQLPNPQVVASNQQHHQHQTSEAAGYNCTQREDSWTESNTPSCSVPETAARNSETSESCSHGKGGEDNTAPLPNSRKRATSPGSKCRRGFVPYKRCAADSELLLKSQAPPEEADGEMTRLCL